ncbi:hypothetical protein CsSME_00003922 [Camellia sinensis var. sinensis]
MGLPGKKTKSIEGLICNKEKGMGLENYIIFLPKAAHSDDFQLFLPFPGYLNSFYALMILDRS